MDQNGEMKPSLQTTSSDNEIVVNFIIYNNERKSQLRFFVILS